MAVNYELADHICTITIDRERALNSLDREHYAAFSEACGRFADDADAWVAIVTGAGHPCVFGGGRPARHDPGADG